MTWPPALLRAAEEISRDGARDAARDELSDPIYRAAEPSVLDRLITRIREWLGDLLGDVLRVMPGGVEGLILLIVIIVGVVVLLRYGAGPLRGRDALTDRRRGAASLTAADYRAEAERLAAAGELKEAIRARFRAVVRELEHRAVLEPRVGRTAGEVAAEAGALVPAIAADLRTGAERFGAVWYGGTAATREIYAQLVAIDDRVRGARLTVRA